MAESVIASRPFVVSLIAITLIHSFRESARWVAPVVVEIYPFTRGKPYASTHTTRTPDAGSSRAGSRSPHRQRAVTDLGLACCIEVPFVLFGAANGDFRSRLLLTVTIARAIGSLQ